MYRSRFLGPDVSHRIVNIDSGQLLLKRFQVRLHTRAARRIGTADRHRRRAGIGYYAMSFRPDHEQSRLLAELVGDEAGVVNLAHCFQDTGDMHRHGSTLTITEVEVGG
jgi:hypothetical protein